VSYGTDSAASSPSSDLTAPLDPLPLIIRATNGNPKKTPDLKGKLTKKQREEKRVKLSTIVQPDDLGRFFERYAEVAKAGMTEGLKKRDRSKRKKKEKKRKDGPSVESAKK
jgi:signal recognition particle subunit SRP14